MGLSDVMHLARKMADKGQRFIGVSSFETFRLKR